MANTSAMMVSPSASAEPGPPAAYDQFQPTTTAHTSAHTTAHAHASTARTEVGGVRTGVAQAGDEHDGEGADGFGQATPELGEEGLVALVPPPARQVLVQLEFHSSLSLSGLRSLFSFAFAFFVSLSLSLFFVLLV
jgi:hypothetical protein